MTARGFAHVNIRTADVSGTIEFFRDVLSMRVTPAPGAESMQDGAWVYDIDGAAIVHLASLNIPYPSDSKLPFRHAPGSGAMHHIALEASGFHETLERIRARGLVHYINAMPQRKLLQIFVRDVNEILFELNFSGESIE